MSKILVAGDVHFCKTSSILNARDDTYSKRLIGLINSLNWVEKTAGEQGCDIIVYLGDFFNSAELKAEELTALNEIQWHKDLKHYFIVGNHEFDGETINGYNSLNTLKQLGFEVLDKPCSKWGYTEGKGTTEYVFLPFIKEYDRKPLIEYLDKDNLNNASKKKTIIFSHNDLKGMQMGKFQSVNGFDLKDIDTNCDLFVNGHLHNGTQVSDKVINLGNLTGQNFSEDAFTYSHKVMILDSSAEDINVKYIENPYAFNFYQLDLTTNKNYELKDNAVVMVKCYENDIEDVSKRIKNSPNIIASRILTVYRDLDNSEEVAVLTTQDHLKQFTEFTLANLGSSEIVLAELGEVCK